MPEYVKASVTATTAIFRVGEYGLEVLLGLRSRDTDAYPGYWCLPGGFLNVKDPKKNFPGETTEECASRETLEETGIDIHPSRWRITGVYSHPETDPRDHVVNVAYWYKLGLPGEGQPGDDIEDLEWVPIEQALDRELAFNHNLILDDSYREIGNDMEWRK